MMSSNVSECSTMKRGTKRKIEIKKRETKQQRSVACSKRRVTLFSKAADICLHSGADIAAFVTSPAENSDVVYSFSGFSSASEIADCYLNGKSPPQILNPQSKLGFWWDDPDLYRYCDDLSELDMIEERMMKVEKHMMDCLEKKGKSQFVSSFDQNPSFSSLDQNPNFSSPSYSSQITFCDQSYHGGSSSQFVSDFDQNPNFTSPSSSKIASFEEKICGEPSSQVTCYDQNLSFRNEDIYGDSSDQSRYLVNDDLGFVDSFWETEKENNGSSLSQETQTQSITNEDQSFWENQFQSPLPGHSSKVASFEENSFSSLEKICGEPFSQVTCYDQNLSFCNEDIYGDSSDQSRYLVNDDLGFVDNFWETEKDNNGMSLSQVTQTQSTTNEDQSFWENIFQFPLPGHSSTNEEEVMIDISEFVNDEEIEMPQSYLD